MLKKRAKQWGANAMQQDSSFHFIDFNSSKLSIEQYDSGALAEDIDHYGVNHAIDLDSPDWRVFHSFSAAKKFLDEYSRVLNELDNAKICARRDVPCLLYKRKYIVQSLMGVKLATYRRYRKDFKPGQLINLHDQTFFLTVRIVSVEEEVLDGETMFKYSFELVKK